MNPELRQFIDQSRFHLAFVKELGGKLPTEDAELEALLAEVVKDSDPNAFTFLLVAALGSDRRVDARHLARGAILLPSYHWLGCAAWHMRGDVPEHLLEAVEQSGLRPVMAAAAVLVAAMWCREHRGGTLPAGLIPAARATARRGTELNKDVAWLLLSVALRTGDAGLAALIKQRSGRVIEQTWKPLEEAAAKACQAYLELCRTSILELVVEKPTNQLASGGTLRRAVARLGRNEPCHCGSRKKYKHCCYAKDQERLHHSSEVAGRTQEELRTEMESHLTPKRMDCTEPHQLARFDPRKIPAGLRNVYFQRLCAFKLLDRAAEAFELLGYSDELKEVWDLAVFFAARAGRKDVIQRLLKVRPDAAEAMKDLYTGAALVLEEDNPAGLVKLLEENALATLAKDDPRDLQGFAYALMFSRFRALGIMVGRGAVPILPQNMAGTMFDHILQTRDKLNLSPDDPIADILDQRFAGQEEDDKKESAELRQAQQKLDTKAQEVQQLKASLERLQKEIVRREQKRATQTPAAPRVKSPPVDELPLKELRRKVEELKSALNERHHERNDLRRELQKAHTDLETLRQSSAPATRNDPEPPDREEELLLPQETAGANQPLRLIEFPRGFQQTLAGLPRHVARGALAMLGRLAGGEAAAFVGAVRLKACPGIMRQRIGIDFRLLFRLLPDRIQVVDLIPRQDLERKIKTLA